MNIYGICFFQLDANGPKLFSFPEFLAGLALIVLAWTIADVRYKFRVRAAPFPLQKITFCVVALIGTLTLLTDLWRAEEWLVPCGGVITPAAWQAILAGIFLLNFLMWAWFAFIRPPSFGRYNAKQFATVLYRYILTGSSSELAIIADELSYSVRGLIYYATDKNKQRLQYGFEGKVKYTPSSIEKYANDLLLLIADKRFCRAIVDFAPVTALFIFQEMEKTKKYGVQVQVFARNIINYALENKNSFLYHEVEGYASGLIGRHKPLSQAIFANSELVDVVGTMLDPGVHERSEWDSEQWEAYCRVVLMVFRDHVQKRLWESSAALNRAMGYIESAVGDLYRLQAGVPVWQSDEHRRLKVVMSFISSAVAILDEKGVPHDICLRRRKGFFNHETCYDQIAVMVHEVVRSASTVKLSQDAQWVIQYASVWSEIFGFKGGNSPAWKVVRFKVRRLIYDDVVEMDKLPNFQGARVLALCLNAMMFSVVRGRSDKGDYALQKAVFRWVKRNYCWLRARNSRVADACLVDGIAYDSKRLRIIKIYSADGLRIKPRYTYVQLDPA